jgi:hypothetical protein
VCGFQLALRLGELVVFQVLGEGVLADCAQRDDSAQQIRDLGRDVDAGAALLEEVHVRPPSRVAASGC